MRPRATRTARARTFTRSAPGCKRKCTCLNNDGGGPGTREAASRLRAAVPGRRLNAGDADGPLRAARRRQCRPGLAHESCANTDLTRYLKFS
jgi:hypothetical protein